MNDITGREIKITDYIVIGKRSGNSGTLDLGVVHNIKNDMIQVTYVSSWNDKYTTKGGTRFPERTAIIDNIPVNKENKGLIEFKNELIKKLAKELINGPI